MTTDDLHPYSDALTVKSRLYAHRTAGAWCSVTKTAQPGIAVAVYRPHVLTKHVKQAGKFIDAIFML